MKYFIFTLLIVVLFSVQACLDAYSPRPLSDTQKIDSIKQTTQSSYRFEIVGNDLCCVSNASLKIYDIQNPASPLLLNNAYMQDNILSVRLLANNGLMIGDANGLSLYSISTSGGIKQDGAISASQYYDPFAYVADTIFVLQSNSLYTSNRFPDFLGIYYSNDLSNPILSYNSNLNYPKDISIDSNRNLFVCDSGLKVFDISDETRPKLISHFYIEANKIRAYNDNLFILGNSGLFQYQYNKGSLALTSKIDIVPAP